MRALRIAAALLLFAPAGVAFAEPLGATTPSVYSVAEGDADLQIFDNARNPGRISSVALGDVDGDGRADFLLGAPYAFGYAPSGPPEGLVYLIYGGFLPPISEVNLTATSPTVGDPTVSALAIPGATPPQVGGFQMGGEFREMRFGSAVAFGDFDGDGRDDFAVAAPRRLNDVVAGRVYLVQGDPAFQFQVGLKALRTFGRMITVVGPDRPADVRFGETVLFLDFDNDGREDLVMGSPRAGEGGEVHVLYGQDFTSDTLIAGEPPPSTATLMTTIVAEAAGDHFGAALAAGDLSADGRPDLIVGSPLSDGFAGDTGKVFVFYGTDRDTTAGLPLPTNVALANTSASLTIIGPDANFAAGYALAAGDLDADGFDDLAIGAPNAKANGLSNSGQVYVLYNDAQWTTPPAIMFPDLASTSVAVYKGPRDGTELGRALVIERFNPDPFEDLMIGVPGFEGNQGTIPFEGAVFGILGRPLAERPAGAYTLNGLGATIESDILIKAGDDRDMLGWDLEMGLIDPGGTPDLFASGNPIGEGEFGSAWGFRWRPPKPDIPIFENARRWQLYR